MSTSLDNGAMKDDTLRNEGLRKSPAGSGSNLNGGFRPTHTPGRADNPIMNVEPPRREDLQPSYAQTLQGESDQGNNGWYGSMSKQPHPMSRKDEIQQKLTICAQSTLWVHVLELWVPSPAASSVLTPTNLSRRVMLVWLPNSVDSIVLLILVSSRSTLSANVSSRSMLKFRLLVRISTVEIRRLIANSICRGA